MTPEKTYMVTGPWGFTEALPGESCLLLVKLGLLEHISTFVEDGSVRFHFAPPSQDHEFLVDNDGSVPHYETLQWTRNSGAEVHSF